METKERRELRRISLYVRRDLHQTVEALIGNADATL